jgi:hypothetical protein
VGSEVDVPKGPAEAPAAEPRVITAAPVRPGRVVARVVNVLALAGLLVTCVLFLVAARAALDLADDVRAALGVDPPASGVDWYRLAVLVVVFAVPVLAALWLARVVRRRYRRRLAERLGDAAPARRFTPGRRFDRKQWLAVLLTTPYWAPRLERWRGQGAVPAGEEGWSDDDYRQVAALVRAELDERLGAIAFATGTAVAFAPRRFADAVSVVAGSAELQIEALATLGLRPGPRAWLHVVRAASTGLLVSTYLDAEDRIELDLAVRAAALGVDETGALLEHGGDELEEALAEALEGVGGIGGAIASTAGAAAGVTSSVARQVSAFIDEVGDEIVEGVVVAAVLHYHGMSLVAEALALDAEHRAELAPRLGEIPRSLRIGATALARRSTQKLRQMLRRRMAQATRRAPARLGGLVIRRRPRGQPER